MLQIKYNDGGFLLTLFKTLGVGVTRADTKDEQSITFTLKIGKAHTFFSLAWI